MKASSLFAWIVAVGITLVLMVLLYAGSKYQITKSNADRIKPGMTSEQVGRILGVWSSIGFTMRDDSLTLVWTGCDCEIVVEFNSNSEVIRASCTPKPHSNVVELVV